MSSKKPNIVLMVSDDHGLDTGCYGNSAINTPNMDALAADGTYFTNSFCTSASCSPSRSVILTGTFSHANGMYGLQHNIHHFSCLDDVPSLPLKMKENGYRTARIGKLHVGPEEVFKFDRTLSDPEQSRNDVQMAENSRQFIEENNDPFFLYWCSYDPHRGGGVKEEHPCKPNRFGNPKDSFPGDTEQEFSDEEVNVPYYLPDTPEVRSELAQYYQSVARLDRGIGRLMEILQETGNYDNTLIIYISDNGAAFPAAKTTLYEPGMHLPCIVKRPGEENQNGVCNGSVSWVDLAPTILDYAGGSPGEGDFHGRSFRKIIGEEDPGDWRDEVYGSHCFHEITNYYPMRVMRTEKHKFIWNIAHQLPYPFASDLWHSASWQGALNDELEMFGQRTMEDYIYRPEFELYDLQNDPEETANLAGRPEYQETVENFCERIKEFQENTDDPWLHKWEYE